MNTPVRRTLSRWTTVAIAVAGFVALPVLAADVAPAGTATTPVATVAAATPQPAAVKVAAAPPTTKAAAVVVPKAAAAGARLTFSDSKCTSFVAGTDPQHLTITCQ